MTLAAKPIFSQSGNQLIPTYDQVIRDNHSNSFSAKNGFSPHSQLVSTLTASGNKISFLLYLT